MNPNIRIKLNGHIYCTNSRYPKEDGFNSRKKSYTLSKDRAAAVYDYLRWRGIDKSRMEFHGYAGQFPTGRASKFDRRVEIEIRAIN
jgi:outer membrane protein OmpA-like peptidoglycan-associated protein